MASQIHDGPREREKRKKATEEMTKRWTKDGGHGRERREKAKKHFRGEGGRLSLNKN
jgi:hypothetical protein